MEPREIDWLHAVRSLAKVVGVSVLLFLALNVAERLVVLHVDLDGERTARVYGTAAQVVNPDKRFHGADLDEGLIRTVYTLRGEPRTAAPARGETAYTVTESLPGVEAPGLAEPERSALTEAVRAVEGEGGSGSPKDKQELGEALDRLPPALTAVAVVEFAWPLTAEKLVALNRRHGLCGDESVSYVYSRHHYDDSDTVPLSNAVVWNRDMAWVLPWDEPAEYRCETEPEAALAAFRTWTGLLREGDDLAVFGLTRDELVDAAREGVAYGFVADRWRLADLRKLLDDPDVRTVRVADLAFGLGTGPGAGIRPGGAR
ncbi:hypothetical protein GCM10010466_37190 [Planomonospora alba]|uniref:Uncharacterized protein n=2 Tax=Planomonospora alba TaxID=161354 RepID=A0ABP6NDR7_9ACTN